MLTKNFILALKLFSFSSLYYCWPFCFSDFITTENLMDQLLSSLQMIRNSSHQKCRWEQMDKAPSIIGLGYVIYGILIIIFISVRLIPGLHSVAENTKLSSIAFSNYIPLILFGIISVVCILLVFLLSFYLFKRIKRTICLVLSAIFLIGFPVGTILGIASIFVLTRSEVKEQFIS